MTSHYCANCFFLRLEQFPSVIFPLKFPLPIHQLIISLTPLQMHSYFPALLNPLFVVPPQRTMWNYPERNQTTLQTSTFSLQQPHGKLLWLRRRTSHQEFPKLKNYLWMKWQLIHLSLRGSTRKIFSSMINFATLTLAIRTLSFGRFRQWSLCSTPQKWPDHHLILSKNRPQVLVVLSSGLTPVDFTSSSTFTVMVLDSLLANVHQFHSPSSLANTTICLSGSSRRSSTLVSVINWIHWTHGGKKFSQIKTRPTRKPQSQQKRVATIMIKNFILQSELFSETEGFLIEGACFIEIKLSDPLCWNLTPKLPSFFPFHRAPQSLSFPFERGE